MSAQVMGVAAPGCVDRSMRAMNETMVGTRSGEEQCKEPFFNEEIAKGLQLIAEHSGRAVIFYDIGTNLTRVCKPNKQLGSWQPAGTLFDFEDLTEEGKRCAEQLLQSIRNGEADGEVKLQMRGTEDGDRWMNLRYSPLVDEHAVPRAAVISYQDISEHHRHELAYLRQKQALEREKTHLGQLEVDLNADIIEMQSGRMAPTNPKIVGQPLGAFAEQMITMKMEREDWKDGFAFFSPQYLLDQYAGGNCILTRTWKMHFRSGRTGWIRVVAELLLEPYTNHVKAFITLTDITIEQETQLLVNRRAEKDGLTGLLNRATLESQVKECMANDAAPGVLVLLDLDELKKINDVYGHMEGDRAIRGVARMLTAQFRQTDIIGRLGGDEFLVYLRGAAGNPEAIAASLTAFSRKLATLTAGPEGSHKLCCSMGCAIQGPDAADFDTLYRQADVALYHVKRGTKNGFAFYGAEMEAQDYQFRAEKMLTAVREEKWRVPDAQRLLNEVLSYYELVLSMNLTTNSYFLAAEIENGVFSSLPAFGSVEDFADLAVKGLHPEDVALFRDKLSRDGMIRAYQGGAKDLRARFRFISEGGYRHVDTMVLLYENEAGDVCNFALLRWE